MDAVVLYTNQALSKSRICIQVLLTSLYFWKLQGIRRLSGIRYLEVTSNVRRLEELGTATDEVS